MEIHCPVCPAKGLLSIQGSTVKYELTARKINILIVRKFYYPDLKRSKKGTDKNRAAGSLKNSAALFY